MVVAAISAGAAPAGCSKRKTTGPAVGAGERGVASIHVVDGGGSGAPIQLVFQYTLNESRAYRVKARQTIDLPAVYDAGVDRSVIDQTSRLIERVVATGDAGADVETTFADVKLTIAGPLSALAAELERATAAYRVETRVGPDGVVRGIKADPSAAPLLKTWLSATSRQLASGPAVFPSEPVAVGGVWRRVEPVAEGAPGTNEPSWSGDLTTEYLLVGVEAGAATIRVATKLALRGTVPKHGTRLAVETTGSAKGQMTFDIPKGIVVRSRLDFVTETRTTGREIPAVAPTKIEGWTETELEKT
ncbi:MAG: hypothetical protein HYY84_06090 [Deltaproteobacteria bacterium]|nr:hypothetical protein [Deltaproteobacteria bacterium]